MTDSDASRDRGRKDQGRLSNVCDPDQEDCWVLDEFGRENRLQHQVSRALTQTGREDRGRRVQCEEDQDECP